MTELESYGVSARHWLSSKQVPASGRVCSWRRPMVWPSSWRSTPASDQGLMLPKDDVAMRISRPRREELGKKERARYWFEVTTRTLKTTLPLRLLQLASCAVRWTKLRPLPAALSQAAVALSIACLIAE